MINVDPMTLTAPDAPPASDNSGRGPAVLSDSAALAQLRAFIAGGGYKHGEKLPPERILCVELGLRRFELRKALDALEQEGALWRHVGKGTFLATNANQSSQNDFGQLAQKLSPADVMRARAALEPAICRDAALHAPAAAIAAMTLTAARARQAATWREYEALDNEFHRQIAEASGSVALLALFDQLNTLRRMVSWGRMVRQGARPPAGHDSFDAHDRIVAAIAARDPELAQAAMRQHLRAVEARLFA
ncbi:FCD domain-containing protein [Paracoccaceae bacterium Fryx2]|nr:FCD domain-containing protein [Paracoccaceae bacterium Fryx2]